MHPHEQVGILQQIQEKARKLVAEAEKLYLQADSLLSGIGIQLDRAEAEINQDLEAQEKEDHLREKSTP